MGEKQICLRYDFKGTEKYICVNDLLEWLAASEEESIKVGKRVEAKVFADIKASLTKDHRPTMQN